MMLFICIAILRSIPNKLGGVIAMVMAIAIILILPITNKNKFKSNVFYPMNKILFWNFVFTMMLLTWIGARPAEEPFIFTGQMLTMAYFSYFIINPMMMKMWDKMTN